MGIEELLHSVDDYKLYIVLGLYAAFVYLALRKKKGAAIFFGILVTSYVNWAYNREIGTWLYNLAISMHSKYSNQIDDDSFKQLATAASYILRALPYWGTFLIVRILHKIWGTIKKVHTKHERHKLEVKRQKENAKWRAQVAEAEKRINDIKGQMKTLQGYELNIVPFMELLNSVGSRDMQFDQQLKNIKSHVGIIEKQRDLLNHQAEEYKFRTRVNVHTK